MSAPSEASDNEADAVRAAVLAVRGGQAERFNDIVTRYERRLFGLGLMVTRNPDAAEDVAQDAFIRAFAHLHAYDERRPFYPWLATIAVRLAQNWRVSQSSASARGLALSRVPEPGSGELDPLSLLIADERERTVWRHVSGLAMGERTAVLLYYRHELTVEETATALGVTAGTVKTLLFRARRKLRESLTHEYGEL